MPGDSKSIRIGTRGSPLALAQAHEVRQRLMAAHGLAEAAFEIVVIRTSGDRIQDRPLAEAGGKGLFTKEIEEALSGGEIDLAVHSMKDMPTMLPAGLDMAAILPREDVRDAFVSLTFPSLQALPAGRPARHLVAAPRRASAPAAARSRGRAVPRQRRDAVERSLAEGVADATLLAVAGLEPARHGRPDHSRSGALGALPAVAQGAIGIEIRTDDEPRCAISWRRSTMPRARFASLPSAPFSPGSKGSCRTPIAGLARLEAGELVFDGEILTPDGRDGSRERRGRPEQALDARRGAGRGVADAGGPGFLRPRPLRARRRSKS